MPERAYLLYRKAALNGLDEALEHVARCEATGFGLPRLLTKITA
jgi:hypothetical protein